MLYMNTTIQIFINNLKAYRTRAGLTQVQLAIQLNKGFNYINGIECGSSLPPAETIDKICEVLKIRPFQLFEEETCAKNMLAINKNGFIDEISKNIVTELKDYINKAISNELDKYLK